MITIATNMDGQRIPHEFYGLSTDEKPVATVNGCRITNGSVFIEMDTKKVYMFDEENEQWLEQ